jgi:hypothetical protein
MQNVSKQTANAERLTKHRQDVATRLKRIELTLEDLRDAIQASWPSASATVRSRMRGGEVTWLDHHP